MLSNGGGYNYTIYSYFFCIAVSFERTDIGWLMQDKHFENSLRKRITHQRLGCGNLASDGNNLLWIKIPYEYLNLAYKVCQGMCLFTKTIIYLDLFHMRAWPLHLHQINLSSSPSSKLQTIFSKLWRYQSMACLWYVSTTLEDTAL